jgi:archaellum component FlaC
MTSDDPRDTIRVERKPDTPQREPMMFQMSAEEAYELQRMRVLSSVQADLLAWGKKRFWAVTIIVALIGFIGVPALVRDIARNELDEARRKSAEAEAAAAVAQEATEEARKAAAMANKQFDEQVQAFRDRLNDINTEAERLTKSLDGLAADIEARASGVREEAALEIDDLRGQIGLLTNQVATLTKEAISSEEAEDFQTRKDVYSREQMMRKEDFYANRNIRVLVVPNDSTGRVSDELVGILQKIGYEAARGRRGVETPEPRSIADNVPTIYHVDEGTDPAVEELARLIMDTFEIRPRTETIEDGRLKPDEIHVVFPGYPERRGAPAAARRTDD